MNFTPENFCYWLQGYFEIVQHTDHREGLPEEALEEIKNHLALVFKKETPQVGIQWPQNPRHISDVQIVPYKTESDPRLMKTEPSPIDWGQFRTTVVC